MGKGLLILVAGAAISGVIITSNSLRTTVETDGEISSYEAEVVAREIARSALNMAAAEVQRRGSLEAAKASINAYDGPFRQQSYQGGQFDVTAETFAGGSIRLTATGYYRDKDYGVSTTLALASPLDAALMVEADRAEPAFEGKKYQVFGTDTQPPSSSVPSNPAFDKEAIKTNESTSRDQFRSAVLHGLVDALPPNTTELMDGVIEGTGNVISSGTFEVSLQEIYEEAMLKCDQTWNSDQRWNGNTTLGSANNPGVYCVNGELRTEGHTKGFGVLVVNGDLEARGDFTWEGLVMVKKADNLRIEYGGNATIYGGLAVVQGESAFNMPVKGKLKIRYLSSSAGLKSSVHIAPNGESAAEVFEPGSNRYGDQVGTFEQVFEKGEQLNFFIKVFRNEGGNLTYLYDHYARGHKAPSGTPYARVTQLDDEGYKWRIEFEDLDEVHPSGYGAPDWDYDDQIIEVEVDCSDPASECGAEDANESFNPWWQFKGNTPIDPLTGLEIADTSGPSVSTSTSELTDPLRFRIYGNGKIFYSAEAIGRLRSKLETISRTATLVKVDAGTTE